MITFNLNIIPKTKGAYIVGGSIRDILAQRIPSDYDFAVSGDPMAFAKKLAKKTNGHIVPLGKPGLTLYRVSSNLGLFDVSPIIGNSITEDLGKRDLTINAMAVEIVSGNLIDPFNGLKDLKEKKIRMVSEQAFKADPIRLLRAYRLAVQFNFGLSETTEDAIRRNRTLINNSAGERIHSELIKIFRAKNSFNYLLLMAESKLLFEIIPELNTLKGCIQNRHHHFDVFDHTLTAYKCLEEILENRHRYISDEENLNHDISENTGILKFAMLLHDIGKPQTKTIENGEIHFYRHEKSGSEIAEVICDRLKFSTSEKKYTSHIIRNHLRPLFLYSACQNQQAPKKATTRFFLKCQNATPDIILHALADSRGKTTPSNEDNESFSNFSKNLIDDYFRQFVPASRLKPLMTGKDLIKEFSLSPSPRFKSILNQIHEARLNGTINSRAEAIEMVNSLL